MEMVEAVGGRSHKLTTEFGFQDGIFSIFLRYKVISGTKVIPNFHFLGEGQSDSTVSGGLEDHEDMLLLQGRCVYTGASGTNYRNKYTVSGWRVNLRTALSFRFALRSYRNGISNPEEWWIQRVCYPVLAK